jgi:hypothetical protein
MAVGAWTIGFRSGYFNRSTFGEVDTSPWLIQARIGRAS